MLLAYDRREEARADLCTFRDSAAQSASSRFGAGQQVLTAPRAKHE